MKALFTVKEQKALWWQEKPYRACEGNPTYENLTGISRSKKIGFRTSD